MQINPSLFRAFELFLIYLRLHKWRSRKTQEQYTFHIWRFIQFMMWDTISDDVRQLSPADLLPPSLSNAKGGWKSPLIRLSEIYPEPKITDIKKEDFDEWRLSLSDAGLSPKTVNAHIITMRSWLKYLKKEEIDCLDPTTLDLMKVTDREVTFLTPEEISRYFSSFDLTNIQDIRDFAISECIYSTGLRVSELTHLDRRDVNLETLEFAVRGKWGKLRTVYLTEEARDAIRHYLAARDDDFSPLFIRHNFSRENIQNSALTDDTVRLSRFFITTMIKDRGVRSGILKNLHAHTLRHSFATTLLTNGADIRIIQELLWHASITTTQVYTHVTNPKLREAHQKFHHHGIPTIPPSTENTPSRTWDESTDEDLLSNP